MANYHVNQKKKVVYAKVALLTEMELKAVSNYQALGYELKEPKEKKEVKNEKFTKKYIDKFLEKNASEIQKEEFKKIVNDVVIDKETKQPKLKKDNTPRVKGYVAAYKWLKDTFPKEFK